MKALIIVVLAAGLSNTIWLVLLHDRALHQQAANHLVEVKFKAEQVAHAEELDAVLAEAHATAEELHETQRALVLAREAAQPCPGPCGVPDCRKLKSMLEGFQACLSFVEQQRVNLGR